MSKFPDRSEAVRALVVSALALVVAPSATAAPNPGASTAPPNLGATLAEQAATLAEQADTLSRQQTTLGDLSASVSDIQSDVALLGSASCAPPSHTVVESGVLGATLQTRLAPQEGQVVVEVYVETGLWFDVPMTCTVHFAYYPALDVPAPESYVFKLFNADFADVATTGIVETDGHALGASEDWGTVTAYHARVVGRRLFTVPVEQDQKAIMTLLCVNGSELSPAATKLQEKQSYVSIRATYEPEP